MIKITQTKLHTSTQTGNCLAACVASLLHLDIDNVPHPTIQECKDFSSYLIRLCTFLSTVGWTIIEWPTADVAPFIGDVCADVELFWIAGGPTTRGGVWHSVVMRGVNLAHDPHPSNAGLTSIEIMTVLTPLCPYYLDRIVDKKIS